MNLWLNDDGGQADDISFPRVPMSHPKRITISKQVPAVGTPFKYIKGTSTTYQGNRP